jgi:hypothetical protein
LEHNRQDAKSHPYHWSDFRKRVIKSHPYHWQALYSDDNVTDSIHSITGLVNLRQARLGFLHPDLMAKIPKGTTSHNIDPEKARALARRTLINTFAHQERHRARRESESQPNGWVNYENGEAWSFDTQE